MDQVKVFLRQCAKHRFWIAFGISLLLPVIGYFVGAGAIVAATTAREGEIKGAEADIKKYQTRNPPTPKYKELVEAKKAVLTTDVDATWRKLYAIQEPLLKWPDVVQEKFRGWGRKWPENVDRGQVQQTIIDYSIAYRDFLAQVYATCKPWDPVEGTGIVFAPEMDILLTPAPFSQDTPPPLGTVWAEQERLWVVTALLDVVAKANDAVKAKDWDTAIIKQIVSLEVGTNTAEDQKSLAKGVALEPAPTLSSDGATAPAAAAAPAGPEGASLQTSIGMGAGAGKSNEVMYLKTEGTPPYKVLPIKMTVLLDQAHLPDFLVGLENSPMAIQVMEPEISRPSTPVTKPIPGETSFAAGMGAGMGMGMGGSGRGYPGMGGSGQGYPGMGGSGQGYPGMMGQGRNASSGSGGAGRQYGSGEMSSGMMGPGRMGPDSAGKKGQDVRSVDKAKERKDKAKKDAATGKAAARKSVDPYYNIIEVTVYGQARFYNTPPAPPAVEPSSSAPAPAPAEAEATKPVEPAKADAAPAKKDEPPRPDAPAAPAPAPTEAPKPGAPAPK